MHLKNLSILNFKNYQQVELELSPKINCFSGLNGVGKTNLLDAIHFLSLTKSYFSIADGQTIRHDEKFFALQGEYLREERTERINCGLKRGQKKVFKRNGKDYTRFSDHIGFLPIVMISPSDYSLIADGSEERRRFMDSVISQFDHHYLDTLIRYNRALSQRNKLLKGERVDQEVLLVWNEQLFDLNRQIHEKRKHFIEKLIPIFQFFYSFVAKDKEQVGIRYKSQLNNADITELFHANQEKDRILQYTTTGIHRDDLVLELGDHPMRKIGSQGQQKTFLVALKFAQFDFMKQESGLPPILLLDDIFDKLDKERVEQIIKLVSDDRFGQIFISDTNVDRMHTILKNIASPFHIYEVSNNDVALVDSLSAESTSNANDQ